jgi:hypothetical protein
MDTRYGVGYFIRLNLRSDEILQILHLYKITSRLTPYSPRGKKIKSIVDPTGRHTFDSSPPSHRFPQIGGPNYLASCFVSTHGPQPPLVKLQPTSGRRGDYRGLRDSTGSAGFPAPISSRDAGTVR